MDAAAVEALSYHFRDDFGAMAAIQTNDDDGRRPLNRAAPRVDEAFHLVRADAQEVRARLGHFVLSARRGIDVPSTDSGDASRSKQALCREPAVPSHEVACGFLCRPSESWLTFFRKSSLSSKC